MRGPASRAELDALADELVAVIVAGEDGWRRSIDPNVTNAWRALVSAAHPRKEGAVPYQGAYDAMMRAVEQLRESGTNASTEILGLARIDPVRAAGFVNDLLRRADPESCSAARSLRDNRPGLIEDELRPYYFLDLCAANTAPRRTRLTDWPRGSSPVSPLVGFDVYYGEGWQSHYVADRPRPVLREIIRCTPAHYAGLRDGDVLLAVNGRDAREDIPAEVTFRGNPPYFGPPGGEATVRAVPPGEPGTEYVLAIERDGAVMEVTVVSVDRSARREIDSYMTGATGTPAQDGCPADPPWGRGRSP
ncbi:MAG: hypothetical protein F4059_09955 [Gemmatimonadetes bacterium]|nr:hypothetical protein [Gemmatimonadota bacterium]